MEIPATLYAEIVRMLPIACVDLLVQDECGRVLLLKRANEPARGQWWFPGGRINFGETRVEAAKRKLVEECGIEAERVTELGTHDVILEMAPPDRLRHGVTTLFHLEIRDAGRITMDPQSVAADWRRPAEWQHERLHPFVAACLDRVGRPTGEG
ncbi:MAG TPA: NUDIX domain-containing protein [Dehalococcoidia bacterium]|jgi:colanic acid biosynthesis protein WcaH|nr:NUDIX domain-containing protein [Dehalococcoidia bacterium]